MYKIKFDGESVKYFDNLLAAKAFVRRYGGTIVSLSEGKLPLAMSLKEDTEARNKVLRSYGFREKGYHFG